MFICGSLVKFPREWKVVEDSHRKHFLPLISTSGSFSRRTCVFTFFSNRHYYFATISIVWRSYDELLYDAICEMVGRVTSESWNYWRNEIEDFGKIHIYIMKLWHGILVLNAIQYCNCSVVPSATESGLQLSDRLVQYSLLDRVKGCLKGLYSLRVVLIWSSFLRALVCWIVVL